MAVLHRADDADLFDLVGRTYEAAYDPARWREVLPSVAAAAGASRGLMGIHFAGSCASRRSDS